MDMNTYKKAEIMATAIAYCENNIDKLLRLGLAIDKESDTETFFVKIGDNNNFWVSKQSVSRMISIEIEALQNKRDSLNAEFEKI